MTDGNLSGCARQNTQGQVSRKKESKGLIGYVHNLSPKKRNKKDTLDYSTLTLQTEDTYQDVLCYSMAKRPLLMTSMTSRTPIKVDRFAKTTDGSKIIINDMTSVAVPNQTDYSFQYTEQEDNITFVSTVIQGHDALDIVNVRGKVVKLLPETTAGGSQRDFERVHSSIAQASFYFTYGKKISPKWKKARFTASQVLVLASGMATSTLELHGSRSLQSVWVLWKSQIFILMRSINF